MPRQVRVEYEGAVYHVMARGNHRERIVKDDEDRKMFEEALESVVERMGWVLYAYVLMGNHYHLVFKTPEANLVKGMTWFQSTVTKRHNARHKRWGHLFSGRYKAILVEENDYLTTLVHYVHLNPVRAKVISPEAGIENYAWSSLADYTKPPTKRRKWIAVEKGLAHMRFQDKAADRRKWLGLTEGLVDRSRLARSGVAKMKEANLNTTLKRGWCFGTASYKESMREKIERMKLKKNYRIENGYSDEQLTGNGEKAARLYIKESLGVLGLTRKELKALPKMDVSKAMIARILRKKTKMNLDWISKELCMGVRSSVTRAEKVLAKKIQTDKKLKRRWEKLNMQQNFS